MKKGQNDRCGSSSEVHAGLHEIVRTHMVIGQSALIFTDHSTEWIVCVSGAIAYSK